jgi:hypothetical protein
LGEGDDAVPVVHVYGMGLYGTALELGLLIRLAGTPYQMGYAHGALLKESARGLIDGVWSYLELQVEQAVNGWSNRRLSELI